MPGSQRAADPIQSSRVGAEYQIVPEERVRSSAPTPTKPDASDAPAIVRRFIGQLIAGYRRLQSCGSGAGKSAALVEDQLHALLLADAAIRYCDPAIGATGRPVQVAVLGPTQTGKTTLVNLVLGRPIADVSPLAGFTVHPQGFCVSSAMPDTSWAADLLPGWQRRAPEALRRDELETYALTRAEPPPAGREDVSAALGVPVHTPCVVWDTPDFDSLAARHYALGVLEIAALADQYVLVLSKEKYSDLSVWRMLALLEPLCRPLVICINKLTPDSADAVVNSLRERLTERGAAWGTVPIVPLVYDAVLAAGGWPESPPLVPQTGGVANPAERGTAGRSQRLKGVQTLLRRHWEAWVAPVRAEHMAIADWKQTVEAAGTRFMAAYVRDYLDHPQRYDSFRRAAVELLELLEIPKVGEVIARARWLVTWPARQVLAAGRAWWRDRRAGPRRSGTVHSLGAEATVLVDTLDALLTELQRDVLRHCLPATPGCAIWQALAQKLDAEEGRLRTVFEAAIKAHDEQMTGELKAAANRLYAELQKQPARLAALRTARATIDLGSILLAIKTGGLTPMDALWAPATLAATSLLMEGVTGLEMGRVARELKQRQRAAVQEQFVNRTLIRELAGLADNLGTEGLLGVAPDELTAATRALAAWEAQR